MTTIQEKKAQLRQQMRESLNAVPTVKLQAWSNSIIAHLKKRFQTVADSPIAVFLPIKSEPNISPLITFLQMKNRILFPRMHPEKSSLDFCIIDDMTTLSPHSSGVFEPPVHSPVIPLAEIQYILVPGLAFDQKGSRLGRGLGYFDHTLQFLSPKFIKIGVCFHNQVTTKVPTEGHDISVDEIFTEQGQVPLHF